MKILVLINAHALAHASRPLEIAKVLRQRGHETIFAGYGKYREIPSWDGFETLELPYMSVEQVVHAVRTQKLNEIYKGEQIVGYIEKEMELYDQLKPNLVITDNRLTACTSAEIAGIKNVGILNVHMSAHRKIPFYSMRNFIDMGENPFANLMDRLQNHFEFLLYDKLVMADINKLRKKRNLPRRFGFALEEGDLTLFPDIPEFNPIATMPKNAHYVGPLTWHNSLPAPACIPLLNPAKKCIYLTIGSEGLDELIEKMSVFADQEVQIVIATGDVIRKIETTLPENIFLEKYVNTNELLPHCNLVVCHGGNGTIYQALNFGLPIVGIATHEEQYYGLKRINQLGLGKGFKAKILQNKGLSFLVDSIAEVLANPKYVQNAKQFQTILKTWNSAEKASDLIESFYNA